MHRAKALLSSTESQPAGVDANSGRVRIIAQLVTEALQVARPVIAAPAPCLLSYICVSSGKLPGSSLQYTWVLV